MFLWLDTETTGLDEKHNRLLEVAAILTNDDLTEVSRHESVIHADPETLDTLNEWAKKAHTDSGLLAECQGSRVTLNELEEKILSLIKDHVDPKNPIILAGNSIHFDRKFIQAYMPRLDKCLHYRMLDVSSYLVGLKKVLGVEFPVKSIRHRAMSDICDSIDMFKSVISRFK